ncbi:mismatch-specific DNA-glycosylase [Bosea vestrisii]|uniref:mismatch-specific DNA-glycosylase n=1 Tax=Bosea vestrisii TaxID=151416 RepID=UPI0024DF63F1|nr:mismatch-specific DNA-glycosylase [Bosea vestrisii]WID95449.1 mismatch-specific DNA-glycosylase [Bosea vestrisii]
MTDHVLPDVLGPGLRVVFCGTQAGKASALSGQYYAGRGNKFWWVIHAIGLVPAKLAASQFRELRYYGVGLTDVAKLTFGPDSSLRFSHFDVAGFHARMALNLPRMIAFNGKRAASTVLGQQSAQLGFGLQPQRLAGVDVFVLPSTAGLASRYWSIEPWRELAALAKEASF